MKNRTFKYIYNIFKCLTIVFLVFTIVLIYCYFDRTGGIKGTNFRPNSLASYYVWGFNGMQIDSNSNIYIGSDYGIYIFDKNGNKIARIRSRISGNNFSFKIEDNQLRIISFINFHTFTEDYEQTYELVYNTDEMFLENYEGWNDDITHDQNFASYKKENGFTETREVEQNGTTYKYLGFGKIKIDDGTTEKTLNLDTKVFPLPVRFAFYPAIVCLLIAIGLKMVLKKKQKQEQLD